MKHGPKMHKLEQMLRSGKIVAGGFMGADNRAVSEIIEADARLLEELGHDIGQIVQRMREITGKAVEGFETWVSVGQGKVAKVEEVKGCLICPWPHVGYFAKRLTILKQEDSGKEIMWSDLNLHMIEEHGFFEGKGSTMRVEPHELVEMIF